MRRRFGLSRNFTDATVLALGRDELEQIVRSDVLADLGRQGGEPLGDVIVVWHDRAADFGRGYDAIFADLADRPRWTVEATVKARPVRRQAFETDDPGTNDPATVPEASSSGSGGPDPEQEKP